MYIKQNPDKFKFNQQFPYHSTCHPATINLAGMMISQSNPTLSSRSARSRSVVVPISASDGLVNGHSHNEEEYRNGNGHIINGNPNFGFKSASISPSTWWSWTFGITGTPFVIWGCPFYILTMTLPKPYFPEIRSTRIWLKRIVDCSSFPFTSILTMLQIITTTAFDIYWLYLSGELFANLFIRGVYKSSMIKDINNFVRDIPVIIAINYIWLRGFKINSFISILNQKYRKYQRHVSCTMFRIRAWLMLVALMALHVIRYFSFKKYSVFYEDPKTMEIVDFVWQFSSEIFVSLVLPVYCLFCYAIRFELLIVKSIIYELISKRVTPTIAHLSKFKTLITHAADHIDAINGHFSMYMSLIIGLIITGTIIDAENLLVKIGTEAIKGIIGSIMGGGEGGITSLINESASKPPPIIGKIIEAGNKNSEGEGNILPQAIVNGTTSDPAFVRQMNADIFCIVATYAMVFYTVWQAVVTNDYVRELHVWLNDFVSGGGGSDIKGKLIDVGADEMKIEGEGGRIATIIMRNDSFGDDEEDFEEVPRLPLLWGSNSLLKDGRTDQFLEKYKMLKAYIHVRMELEKPSLLNIALVGLFVPNLSGRLKRYNVLF